MAYLQGLVSGGFVAACEDNDENINPMTGAYIPYVMEWIKEKAGDDLTPCIPDYNDIEHVFGQRPLVWTKPTIATTTTVGKAKQNVSLEKLN